MCRWVATFVLMDLLTTVGIAAGAARDGDRHWEAKPAAADAPVRPCHARIVDYGDDFAWNYNEHMYRGGFQNQRGIPKLDLDEDGQQDDCVAYWEFSLTQPLNPVPPHWDTEATSSIFYGGFTGFFLNRQTSSFTEMCTNVDHPGDNINMMVTANNQPYRCYGIWLWQKEDFLNGGDAHRVSFDAQSVIGLHIGRYWVSVDEGRYAVQDGDQFYISEFTFAGDCYEGQSRGTGITHVLRPTQTRWARYDPQPPHDIVFDPARAEFKEHSFSDVQAVGYYAAKTDYTTGSTWLKQYAFEVYASVHRPDRPSELLDMAAIPETELALAEGRTVRVPAFHVSTCEVPYAAWQRVWRWAVSPMYAFEPGYVFDRDGDMGSMDLGSHEHGPNEPATDMTWLDAVAWCNALSELEGREVVYYADAGFGTPFRKVRERWYDRETNRKYVPKVHVKWDADGYRLPTVAEWAAAAGNARSGWTGENSGGATHPVGTMQPNEHGVHDALGNVWEWVWDAGEDFDDPADESHTVLGGGLSYPETETGSPYGDVPFSGNYNIGFRVVRNVGGKAAMPPTDVPAGPGVPHWTFRKGEKTQGIEPTPTAGPLLELVSIPEGTFPRADGTEMFISAFRMARCETTYDKWQRVRDWAEAKGYSFNYDGDMGSMYHETGLHSHSPDEPVTRVTAFDMFAWCNALSEMDGRTPCYYANEARREVYRQSLPYREAMTFRGPWGNGVSGRDREAVFVNWAADGYRLPTRAEWEYACRAGSDALYYWGDRFDERYAWCAENADRTTHPIGKKLPNALGLYDMAGNVFERCWGAGRSEYDPFDLRNPKGSVGTYHSSIVRGGSFRYPSTGPYARYFQPAYQRPGCRQCFAYPEIGFRVLRCEAGTHPADGVETVEIILNDVDTSVPPDLLARATFRGGLHRTGVYDTKGLPELGGLKWKFQTGGPVKSSPAVVDGVVYVGSDDGHLHALDGETGGEVWKFKAGGPVHSSGTVANGRVYFGSNRGLLYALDARSGEPAWQFTVPGCKSVGGSPVVAYGCVFAYMRGWGYKTGLVAVDAESGEKICRYPISDAPNILHAFTLAEGQLLANGGGNANGMGAGCNAVDVRTGRPRELRTDRVSGTPVYEDGVVYGSGMCISAVDFQTGQEKWVTWLEGTGWKDPETYQSTSHAAPLLYGGSLYVGNETGHFYAFDALRGKRRWRIDVGGPVRSSAAGAGGAVYFGCDDGHLYALDAATGRELWKFKTAGPIRSSPCVADGVVYVGSDDGCLYAVH